MTRAGRARSRRARAIPLVILAFAFLLVLFMLVWEDIEEAPRVPYELAEYAGVTPSDLGTARLFDDSTALKVSIVARRPGRVRFLVAGDGGDAEDPAKRALSGTMERLCRRDGCDFVLFVGDNVYQEGIDTFTDGALADSMPVFDLHARFLEGLAPARAASVADRVRAAAGRVARACGRARVAAAGSSTPEDSGAGLAWRRHFEPKFERTFAWLGRGRIPAFVLLGNHDVRSPFGAECEIGYSGSPDTAWRMPFYFYQVEVKDPAGGEPLAALFALYSAAPHADPRGENHVRIGQRQRAWLVPQLAAARARWTLVASHHPVWSAGRHLLTEYLSFDSDVLDAARRAGARPDLLLAGHSHWLESARVRVDGAPALQVVSGSLSEVSLLHMLLRGYPLVNTIRWRSSWREELRKLGTDPDGFLAADRSMLARGFALVDLGRDEARVTFYGMGGWFFSETLRKAARTSRSARPIGSESSSLSKIQR